MSVLKYRDPNTGEYKLVIGGGGGGNVSTPDWNQNDETASDYIKNRPFYSELVEILPETTAKTIDLGGLPGIVLPFVEFNPVNVYKVTYNGKIYTCSRVMSLDADTRMIGNTGVLDGTGDTGEPFIAISQGDYTMVADFSGAAEVTIKIERENVIKKISPNYFDTLNFFFDVYYSETDSMYKTDVSYMELESAILSNKMVVARVHVKDSDVVLQLQLADSFTRTFGGILNVATNGITFITLQLSEDNEENFNVQINKTICEGRVQDFIGL